MIERFWSTVDQSGGPEACWPWTGYRDDDGYGTVRFGEHNQRAHRVAWALTNGPIPDGLDTLHHCDNPPCCNPSEKHLFTGTQADNNADMVAKGRDRHPTGDQNGSRLRPERLPRGEGHALAKLTAENVRSIRAGRDGGATQQELAAAFGVTRQNVSLIVRGSAWSHVDAGGA